MAENAVNTEQGVILEALNNKVDLNQLNTDNQGLSYVSGLGMPSDRYIDLELGATGSTYTAPANGYVAISCIVNANGRVKLFIPNINIINGLIGGGTARASGCTIPILKGQEYTIFYDSIGTLDAFRFIYAQGESEE